MSITRTIVIDDLTPEELAHIFAEMDGEQQARFFSNVGQIAATWPGAGWCQQSCEISRHLDLIGTETILKLGEWAAEPYQAELLEALEGAMPILGRVESSTSGLPEFDYVGPRVAKAREAIAKATGGAA